MAKKSKKPRKSKSAEVSPSATKARLLEQLVADLYKLDDVTVETNVFVRVPENPERKREIDVLVTGHFAGLAMRIPIECKNYKRRIQAPDIDAFVGKLNDLRLPLQGVYVSTIGFSSGALECAEKANIKTLLLSGLVGGRLASAVIDAVQSIVYLLPQLSQISVQNDVEVVKDWGYLHTFFDPAGTIVGSTPDIVWTDWVTGRIPETLGPYSYDIAVPDGWYQRLDGVISIPRKISVTVDVVALVVDLRGTGTRHALHNARSGHPEKFQAKWKFTPTTEPLPVLAFASEEDLSKYLSTRPGGIRVTLGRVRLPRIRSGPAYWPPSQRVASRIAELQQAFLAGRIAEPDLSDQDLEGGALDTIFEPIWSGQRIFPGGVRPVHGSSTEGDAGGRGSSEPDQRGTPATDSATAPDSQRTK